MPSSTAAALTVSLLAMLATATPLGEQPPKPVIRLDPRAMDRPRLGSVPYGQQLKSCVQSNMIALTFDDGPGQYTDHVLDLLEKAGNLKATFFLNGKNGQNGMANAALSSVLKRMMDAGHQLASHSYSHKNFDEISEAEQTQELLLNEEAFANLIGMVPTYFRPPFTACGATCLATANKLAYHVTDYDLDTKDYEGKLQASKNKFQEGILQAPKSWVALAHDIHELTANSITPFMIDAAKAKGYKFVTMGDCLGDPKENWYRDPITGRAAGSSGSNNNVKQPAPATTTAAPTTTARTTVSSSSSSPSSSATAVPPARLGNSTTSGTAKVSGANLAGSPAATTSAPAKDGSADRTSVGAILAAVVGGATAFALFI